jgi:hypothetical protein
MHRVQVIRHKVGSPVVRCHDCHGGIGRDWVVPPVGQKSKRTGESISGWEKVQEIKEMHEEETR